MSIKLLIIGLIILAIFTFYGSSSEGFREGVSDNSCCCTGFICKSTIPGGCPLLPEGSCGSTFCSYECDCNTPSPCADIHGGRDTFDAFKQMMGDPTDWIQSCGPFTKGQNMWPDRSGEPMICGMDTVDYDAPNAATKSAGLYTCVPAGGIASPKRRDGGVGGCGDTVSSCCPDCQVSNCKTCEVSAASEKKSGILTRCKTCDDKYVLNTKTGQCTAVHHAKKNTDACTPACKEHENCVNGECQCNITGENFDITACTCNKGYYYTAGS